MQMKSRRNAYTLIEVFVILGIVAILAAILLPVFTRTHCGSSTRANCQSNLKQLGLALLQYTTDYDEKLPPIALNAVPSSLSPFSRPYGWADAIQPYAKSTQILQCPSEKSSPVENAIDATLPGFSDYWFNTKLKALSLKKIVLPDKTFLLGEGNDGRDGSDARYNRDVLPQKWVAPLPLESDLDALPSRRHLDTANYLFADGHVKSLKPAQIVAQDWFFPNTR